MNLTIISYTVIPIKMITLPMFCKLLCDYKITTAFFLIIMLSPTILLQFIYLCTYWCLNNSFLYYTFFRLFSGLRYLSISNLNFTAGFSDWFFWSLLAGITYHHLCRSKHLITGSLSLGEKQWFVAFLDFLSLNTPTVADFKLPTWYHVGDLEDLHTTISYQLVM